MKRPDKKDYGIGGTMINPHGSYYYEEYANELEKYSNYLESKLKNFSIYGIDGFYYLKAGDTVINGDEYYKTEDGKWYTIDDADDGYEFEPEYMYDTRRKV